MVLGIGVNVNFDRGDFPPDLQRNATSIKIETGRTWPRAELAAGILTELDRCYRKVAGGGFASIAEEWEELCATLGRNVEVLVGDRVVQGRAESLDTEGALLLRTEHGRLERIVGGDVTLKK
jgi:BirA family biotin operon repressor/biotin-[acetyl-CoA-carboxylase] ligase